MIVIKRLTYRILNWISLNRIRTTTQSGTTNAQGALRLSNVPNGATVLAVTVTAGTGAVNLYGMPFKYNNSNWYSHVVDWQNLSLKGNLSVTLKVWYIVGGVLHSSIFKAFSDCKPSERMVASC